MLGRFGMVVGVVVLMTVLGAAPVRAQQMTPPLILTPASGPPGTTVTVSNTSKGPCVGFFGFQDVDLDVSDPAGDEIPNTDPAFATRELLVPQGIFPFPTGDWTATFTVPSDLGPGDKISVGATCEALSLFTGRTDTFNYAPATFTVMADATNDGGTTTTTRGGTTGVVPIPPGGGGTTTPVASPLAVQPRFTG